MVSASVKSGNLRGQQLQQLAAGHGGQGVHFAFVGGIAEEITGDALVLKPAGYDVFSDYNADGGGHCDTPGLRLSATGSAIEAGDCFL